MWLVSLSKSDWDIAMLCRCRSEYRLDAAGAFSACREVHVLAVFPHLRPAFACILKQPLLLLSILLLSTTEQVSSITLSTNSTGGYAVSLATTSPALSPTCQSHLRAPRPYESLSCSSHNPTGPLFISLLIASLELFIIIIID